MLPSAPPVVPRRTWRPAVVGRRFLFRSVFFRGGRDETRWCRHLSLWSSGCASCVSQCDKLACVNLCQDVGSCMVCVPFPSGREWAHGCVCICLAWFGFFWFACVRRHLFVHVGEGCSLFACVFAHLCVWVSCWFLTYNVFGRSDVPSPSVLCKVPVLFLCQRNFPLLSCLGVRAAARWSCSECVRGEPVNFSYMQGV